MTTRRQYTEAERATALAALDAHNGDVMNAAKWAKVPRKTLEYWRNGGAVNEPVAELRQIKTGELADRLEELAHMLVGAAPDKIAAASLQMVATSIGIAVDKMQLLRNKPTTITEDVSSLPDDELDRRIAALENRETQTAGSQIPEASAPA